MNPVRRYDTGPAIIASMISRVNGGKAKPIDFMAYGKDFIEAGEDEFIAALGQGVKLGR